MEEQEQIQEQSKGLALISKIMKVKAKDTAEDIIEKIREGETDAGYIAIILKKFEKVSEAVFDNKEVKEIISDKIKTYIEKGKTANLHGSKVIVQERGYWDYSTTDDPYLQALKEIEKEVRDLIKSRTEEIEIKAEAWHKSNNPTGVIEFGIQPFNIMIERIPRLEWDAGIDVIETNPPTKHSRETLAFYV